MDNVIIYDKLEELNEGIESNGGGITSLLGKGCVKSVQRGSAKIDMTAASGKTVSKSITISTVDLTKSILIIFAGAEGGYSSDLSLADTTVSLSETSIKLSVKSLSSNRSWCIGAFFWQVIEFY